MEVNQPGSIELGEHQSVRQDGVTSIGTDAMEHYYRASQERHNSRIRNGSWSQPAQRGLVADQHQAALGAAKSDQERPMDAHVHRWVSCRIANHEELDNSAGT